MAICSVTEIKKCTVDSSRQDLVAGGPDTKIAVVEWLFDLLDKPANVMPDDTIHEFRPNGNPSEVFRVFYIKHSRSRGALGEIATLLRSITETRLLFTYYPIGAVVVDDISTKVAIQEWLVNELDQPLDAPAPVQQARAKELHEYRPSGTSDDVVRIFYLPDTPTVAEFQRLVTSVRTDSNVRRLFTYNALRAAVLRDTEDRIVTAGKLFEERTQAQR